MAPATDGGTDIGNVFGAFGTVLGYIGAEAATARVFESLLWPQRSYSNFHASNIPWLALLKPMGGPMQKAALKVFDVMFRHDLFNGPYQGHMLGTAFFPELKWSYTMHGQGVHETHTEPLRNCIWARVMSLLPTAEPESVTKPGDEENALKTPSAPANLVRARFRVNHLKISRATANDKERVQTFVHESTHGLEFGSFMAILSSELTAVLTAVAVAVLFRTPWAILWVIPLIIHLISALFAVERERLMDLTSSASCTDPPCAFEVHSPETQPNFLLITGAPTVVLQFARHYGHPRRNRLREIVQLTAVVAFACLFPLELACSTMWMPVPVQNVWLCYQLYCVLAMHVARYSRRGSASGTAEALAEALSSEDGNYDGHSSSERCILFGHTRGGVETLKITLVSTYHRRYREGREALQTLVRRHGQTLSRSNSSGSDITLAERESTDGFIKAG